MNERRSLLTGQTGQLLDFYPPEWVKGVPTSAATYAVFAIDADLDDAAEFSGTATADSVNTTFSAASGPSQATNRDRCYLNSVTGIKAGRLYVAANADGQRE